MIDSVLHEGAGAADLKRAKRQRPQAAAVDRLPPHALDMEQGVLGCILIAPNECMGQCIEKMRGGAETFYDLRHQTIYDALVEMFEAREAIEVLTLQQKLKDKQLLEQVGGLVYLSGIPDIVPSAANLTYYLDVVLEKYLLRRMIHVCTDVVGRVYAGTGDVAEMLDAAERDILRIRPNQLTDVKTIKQLAVEALGKMEQMWVAQGKISGLPTGLNDLDKVSDGMHQGEVICLAAYPSAGKTALAMNIAVETAKARVPVFVASCEMMPKSLTVRMICAEARVNMFDIRDGIATEGDFQKISVATAQIAKLPLHIENCNGATIGELVAMARRMKQQHNIGFMVIDYLQLLSNPGSDSREQEVSAVSKGIKTIAMQLGIPVLALSQLNDDGKLRESRAIGQDADSVWFLDVDGERVPRNQPVVLRVEKNREGPAPEKVGLMFLKQFTRFESRSRIEDGHNPTND